MSSSSSQTKLVSFPISFHDPRTTWTLILFIMGSRNLLTQIFLNSLGDREMRLFSKLKYKVFLCKHRYLKIWVIERQLNDVCQQGNIGRG